MGGIAGLVRWGNHSVSDSEIQLMLDRIPHRGADGFAVISDKNAGFGHARTAIIKEDSLSPGVVWLKGQMIGIVADARIYNRKKLLSALALSELCGDAELILSGFLKYGYSILDKLEGDFSFAIFDRVKQSVFAARDIVGARPFFYSSSSDRFVFGSEPKQIIGLPFGVDPSPNPIEVARYISDPPLASEQTIWQSISRLKAGHYLTAESGSVAQYAYWSPKIFPEPRVPYEAYISHIRKALFQAVESRLAKDTNVAIQLSGGYDSSTLALIAHDIETNGKNEGGSGTVTGLSATYVEEEVDESIFINAVAEKLSYPVLRYQTPDNEDEVDLAFQAWCLDFPPWLVGTAGDQKGVDKMRESNARILITGFGGDDVFWEPDYEIDLIGKGRFFEAFRRWRMLNRRSLWSQLKAIVRGLLRVISPRFLNYLIQLLDDKARRPAASLMSQECRDVLSSALPEEHARVLEDCPSRYQSEIFEWMTSPRLHWMVEYLELFYAYQGIEVRHPYLDKALMEMVLSLPLEMRLHNIGRLKPLLQDAAGDLLPDVVRNRNSKAIFDPYFINLFANWKQRLQDLLEPAGELESRKYLASDYGDVLEMTAASVRCIFSGKLNTNSCPT